MEHLAPQTFLLPDPASRLGAECDLQTEAHRSSGREGGGAWQEPRFRGGGPTWHWLPPPSLPIRGGASAVVQQMRAQKNRASPPRRQTEQTASSAAAVGPCAQTHLRSAPRSSQARPLRGGLGGLGGREGAGLAQQLWGDLGLGETLKRGKVWSPSRAPCCCLDAAPLSSLPEMPPGTTPTCSPYRHLPDAPAAPGRLKVN